MLVILNSSISSKPSKGHPSLEETLLDNSISSKLLQQESFLIDPVLLREETKTKLTLFILDSSISSKLFFLEILLGSWVRVLCLHGHFVSAFIVDILEKLAFVSVVIPCGESWFIIKIS
jgi:hypothetical protein